MCQTYRCFFAGRPPGTGAACDDGGPHQDAVVDIYFMNILGPEQRVQSACVSVLTGAERLHPSCHPIFLCRLSAEPWLCV